MECCIPDMFCNDTLFNWDLCPPPDYPDPDYPDPFPDEYGPNPDFVALVKKANLSVLVIDVCSLCLASISFLTNGTILTIYCRMKHSCRKNPNFMLLNQAIADIILSTFAMLSILPTHLKSINLLSYPNYARVTTLLGQYTVFLSLGVLLLTSGERYLALKKPFFHRRFVSKAKMRLGIGIVYTVAFLPCIAYICFMNSSGVVESRKFLVIYGSIRVSLVFAGIVIILSLLFLSYRAVKTAIRGRCNSLLPTADHVQVPKRKRMAKTERRKQKKMISIFITMATVFTVSYLPMGVFNTVRGFAQISMDNFGVFLTELLGLMLYLASAFINPLLTLCLKDDYKRYLPRINRMKRKKEPETEILDISTSLL